MKRIFTLLTLLFVAQLAIAQDYDGGWRYDPRAIAQAHVRPFAATPAYYLAKDLPSEVYLWKVFEKVVGKEPPCKNQGKIGSCVSFGTNNAISMTFAAQIAIDKKWEYKDFAEEVTYGGSRVQIGGGKLRGDGSVGAWAAKFVQQYGLVSRDKHGNYDLTTYSVQTCREFGSKGCPADLIPIAKQSPVKDIAQVNSWAQAKAALAQGYGIAVCSSQGFQGKRDANGVKKPAGSWAHCMAVWGYCSINGQEHGYIQNSWGPEEGPVGPGNPNKAGFWAASTVIDRMLKAGDSFAFSGVVGFPSRKLDWFVYHPTKERDLWNVCFWLRPGFWPWPHPHPN